MTEAIKYNKSCHLAEFFRRYSEASPEMRGNDQSVMDPTLAEAVTARRALNLDNTVPLVKLTIPDMDGSRASVHEGFMEGGCTRYMGGGARI